MTAILGLLVTANALWFIAREVDWRVTWAALSQADQRYLALALGAMLSNIIAKALRWQWLFYPAQQRLKPRHLLSALLIGQLGNVLLPTRLGDLARIWVISQRQRLALSQSLLTVAVEKALDSLMLLLVLAALLPVVPLPPWLSSSKLVLSGLLGLALGAWVALAAHEPLRQRMQQALQRLHLGALARWLEEAMEAISHLRALRAGAVQARLWGLSLAIWLLSGCVNYFAFRAVRLDLPFAAGMLLAVTEITGTNVAYTPAAIGVYHSICILTLSLFGVPFTPALSVALFLYLVVYIPIIVGGLLAVWLEGFNLRQMR
ncbi:MAG: lysylphosphatidylglycerol synthase transmembrane domain-containing protein [Anaerolineae bacterium]